MKHIQTRNATNTKRSILVLVPPGEPRLPHVTQGNPLMKASFTVVYAMYVLTAALHCEVAEPQNLPSQLHTFYDLLPASSSFAIVELSWLEIQCSFGFALYMPMK